jgi:PAS domain-containing protein
MTENPPGPHPADPPSPQAAGPTLGTWKIDIQSDYTMLSPLAQQLFSIDDQSLPISRQAVMTHIHPDDQPQMIAAVLAAFTADQPYAAEFRLDVPGGGWRRVRSHGRVVRDEQGLAQFFLGAMADISGPHDADAVRAALDAALQAVSPDRIEDIAG